MVFSSITFLYYFLPITLLLYIILPKRFKNSILLIASLFFYFYGEPKYIFVLVFSCIFNYYYGKIMEKTKGRLKTCLLVFNLFVNFGILFYFKYFHFFLENVNYLFHTNFIPGFIVMPIGISFFTFQATSYVIDIYRGKVKSAKSVFAFATYLSLFPQLIAGPIVRYETIAEELENRHTTAKLFSDGVKRFIVGLSKKVLLANVLGEFTNSLLSLSSQSVLSYWLQAISNSLQIYLDFSGYSDMAIGLGLLFGFQFLENFNYPFIAHSITDFWRRWHISLSSWFRDYIYIPLGGSKKGNFRRYINIFIVWMTTGLWHGASWNFIFWGVYFAFFLIMEKIFLLKCLNKHKAFGHFYTLFVVIISFILFNIPSLRDFGYFLKNMFGLGNIEFSNIGTFYYFRNYIGVLFFSVLTSIPFFPFLKKKLKELKYIHFFSYLEPIFYIILLIVSTAFIVDESFNPFLYFRF